MSDSDGTPNEESSGPEGSLTIEQVSRIVGVPIPTIRSWERRHKVPVVDRTPGGHRRYTPVQLDALRRMRDLVADGLRPVDAAARVKAEETMSRESLIGALLGASHDLNPDAIGEVLDTAEQALGLGCTVDDVVLPAMRQIGQQWQSGWADVSHEHLITYAIQGWLFKHSQTGPPLKRLPPIVLCCGPHDDHSLALEALGALLREHGLDCRLLGARTPAQSLVRAVHDTSAVAVVLVCHLAPSRRAAVDALHLAELTQTTVYYAGGAFASPQARRGVPGHYLGDNLTKAAGSIATALHDRTSSTPPNRALDDNVGDRIEPD